jgi:hypothetical protein
VAGVREPRLGGMPPRRRRSVPERTDRRAPPWPARHGRVADRGQRSGDDASKRPLVDPAREVELGRWRATSRPQRRPRRGGGGGGPRGGRLVHPCDAAEYLTRIRRQGLTGVARFEAWLDHVAAQSAPAQSGLEQLLADIVQRSGLPDPERQFPLTLPRGGIVHLDLAWPAIRLALEPGHSWWHGGDLAMRADQERDRACGEVGWHVVRYDESVRQHRDSAARELVGIYRERARLVFASRSTPASAGERAILRTDRPGTTP